MKELDRGGRYDSSLIQNNFSIMDGGARRLWMRV